MAFKKFAQKKYPPRQWALLGPPSCGKSTFAVQMKGPILPIDADHRFTEVLGLAAGEVYELSDNPADHVAVESINRQLRTNMPGSGVRTIVVDSLTAIITPLVVEAIMANDAGQNRNKVRAFRGKALAIRLLQDSVTHWGVDTLWIYHTRQGLDANARQVEATSISTVELARLRRSLNMELRVILEGNRRGIVVDWARRGRYPVTLWDETGFWSGMPERIEEAVYGGLTHSEMDALEKAKPSSFRGPDDAIAWGLEQGCFRDAVHAKNAYEQLKREREPSTAAEMWSIWIENVQTRVAVMKGLAGEESDNYHAALLSGVEKL